MLYLIPSIFNEIEVIWRTATNLLLLFCFYFLLFWMATICSCISFLLFYFFDIVIQDLKICLSLNLIHSVLNEMEVIWRKNCVFVLLFCFSFCFFERPNVYYFFWKFNLGFEIMFVLSNPQCPRRDQSNLKKDHYVILNPVCFIWSR